MQNEYLAVMLSCKYSWVEEGLKNKIEISSVSKEPIIYFRREDIY